MAVLTTTDLWHYNFCKVIFVDVTDDYLLMEAPLPSELYPVVKEVWLPRHKLWSQLKNPELLGGYLYDWHEAPNENRPCWTVGVVHHSLSAPGPVFPTLVNA